MIKFLMKSIRLTLIAMAVGNFGISTGVAQDWPSRGGGPMRNAVRQLSLVPAEFQIDRQNKTENVKWIAELGMGLGSEPAIANGLVWIGGNNKNPRDPKFNKDAGVLFCFRETDGKFLYQHISPRRDEGRKFDWPSYGIASTPWVEGDRLYFCTNRCETVCLNIKPLIEGTGLPKELWKVDMVEKFGVFPGATHIGSRHLHCSPVVWGDFVYVNTTHTVHSYQMNDVADREPAPSLLCFNRHTGKRQWSDNSPGNLMLGPQWNNPTVIRADGVDQVVMGQGDGWVRSFNCQTGELIWKFDMNEKLAQTELKKDSLSGRYRRQAIAEPVFCNDRLFLVGGYEYEAGNSTGRVCCIDPASKGDVSSELLSDTNKIIPNPKSALIWEFKGSPSGEAGWKADNRNANVMHSSFGSVAVARGFAVVVDLNGIVHCLDEQTGKRHWSYDTLDAIWGTPLIMGEKIITSNEGGIVYSIPLSQKLELEKIEQNNTYRLFQNSPSFANGCFYFSDYQQLTVVAAVQASEVE